MAGAALVSCTKNESVETPEQDVITFAEPVTALNTKAVEIGAKYPESQNFSVFAHYYTEAEGGYTKFADGDIYMDDVETAYNSDINGWDSKTGPSNINYYWPKQGTLTFAAYSPSVVNAKYDAEGIHFEDFTVDTDCTKQFDLLYSERAYDKTKADMVKDKPYSGVELKFNHALSSILFTVKTDEDYSSDNFEIILKKLSIKNVSSKATFNQKLDDAKNAVTASVAGNFGWGTYNINETEYVAYEAAQTLTNVLAYTNNIKVTNPRENDVNNTNLILIPQTWPDRQLYIEYQIVNKNVTPNTVVDQTATFDLTSPWERGKRYVYNLTFGFDKIYFDPVVTEWDEVVVTPGLEIGK